MEAQDAERRQEESYLCGIVAQEVALLCHFAPTAELWRIIPAGNCGELLFLQFCR